ncbi:hypothetical protein [Nocardia otitidiscaviarum]|uniref:hypothetical protein n=1 Tax=Nocardia otitidiscaviarum TaxID=1823 RepID=UPI003F6A27BD
MKQYLLSIYQPDDTEPPENLDEIMRDLAALNDQLTALSPGSIVALHRAVALAEVHGPEAGLAAVDTLELAEYHLFHAIRANLLHRLGRHAAADRAYAAALERTKNTAERAFLTTMSAETGRVGPEV